MSNKNVNNKKSFTRRIIAVISIMCIVLSSALIALYMLDVDTYTENPAALSDISDDPNASAESSLPEESEPEQEESEESENIIEADDVGEHDEPDPPEAYETQPEVREITVSNISDVDNELSQLLDGVASDFNCISVSLAVFHGEFDFYTYQFGYADMSTRRPIDEETKFRVASLSKYTTAVLVMALVERGLIDLDEDISVYLGYEVRNPNFPDMPITARMLLQHTSSITDAEAYLTARFSFRRTTTYDLLRTRSMFSRETPGSQFEYSDFGFIVLGAICEAVTGKYLDELAKEILFEPLGIDAAYAAINLLNRNIAAIYNRNHNQNRSVQAQLNHNPRALGFEHNLAQGGLMISAVDFAKVLAMLANGGKLGDVRILSEESINEIHLANLHTEFGYSQGLAVRFQENAFMGYDVFWHTGSAYGIFAQFVYCRETMRGVVVVTTGTTGERFPNGMIRATVALSELVWEKEIGR